MRTQAALAVLRRPFSSASHALQELEFPLYTVDHIGSRTPHMLSPRSEIRWSADKNRSARKANCHLDYFLSFITSSDVSVFAFDPDFEHGIRSYALVLHILTKHGIPFHLHRALSSMTQKCFSTQNCLLIFDFWRHLITVYSYELKYRLTSKCYNTLFKVLARFGLLGQMKLLYTDMLELTVSPGIYPYNLIINVYCKLGYVVEARQYVCKMIQAGLPLDYYTYTSLILGYSRRMDLDSAFQIFKDMPCRNVVSYNHLIHCLCDAGRTDEAVSLFARMKDDCLDPTTYTYNALIKGFCKTNLHKAMRLLHEMEDRNLVPSLVTYNLLIVGQCRSGNLDIVYRLLGLIDEIGLAPDNRTYGCIIDCLCKSNRVEEARRMFDILDKKHQANLTMYNSLVDGYCKAGKLDDARLLSQKMETEGCCLPDSYTFTALIHGLCSDGNLKEALSLLGKMVKMGLQPTVCTYTILIRKMLKEGDFDQAHKCLREMTKPDAQTYNSFIEAYCSAGRVQEAEELMMNMKEDGVLPDVFTYTFLVKAYGYLGMTFSAFDVLKRMSDAHCEPSHHTFLALIKHLLEKKYAAGKCDETGVELVSNFGGIMRKMKEFGIVVELFEKMVEHGCAPDAKCYEKLVFGMCKVLNLGIAQRVLDQMEKRGMLPSEMVLNALLSCCCKLQKYGEAAKVMEDMICCGQSPELKYSQMVICRLYEGGEKEKAKSLFQKLLGCGGYYDDEIAWKILIEGLLKEGLVEPFSELFQAMKEKGCHFSSQTHLTLTQGLHGKTDPIT